MTKKRKITMLFLAIAICLSCFLSCLITNTTVAYASSISVDGGYSSVLEDLGTDADFNSEDYPVNANDYSLQVIQIAESSDKELFVYVYQPSASYGKLVATTITISRSKENVDYQIYDLVLLNSSGVFYKYVVKNFVVSSDSLRYYNITEVHRKWNEKYDEGISDDTENTIDEVPFEVGYLYTVGEQDGQTLYGCKEIETIVITGKYCGFIRYQNNVLGSRTYYDDRHFVAFSTDVNMERLMRADVGYIQQYFTDGITAGGSAEQKYVTINEEDTGSNWGGLFGAYKYTWDRIQKPSEFLASENVNFSDMTQDEVGSMDWVLNFVETDYVEGQMSYPQPMSGVYYGYNGYHVLGVTILSLTYETDGDVYNVGVIDNKQTGSFEPVAVVGIEWAESLKLILAILFLILLIIILSPFLPIIINWIIKIIKFVFKVIIWIITLPFKSIKKRLKKHNHH